MFHPCGCGSCTRFRSPFDVPAIIEKIHCWAGSATSLSEQIRELRHRHPGCPDQRTKRAGSQFAVLRYGQARWIARLEQNCVTPVLPVFDPSRPLERTHGLLPGNERQARHQTVTSTSWTAMVKGI